MTTLPVRTPGSGLSIQTLMNGTFVKKGGKMLLLKQRFATWRVDVRLVANYVGIVIRKRGGQERDIL